MYVTLQDLTYAIRNFPSDLTHLSEEDVESTIKQALQMCSNASQLTFTRVAVPGGKADLNFKFVTSFHGDGHPADGPRMELAHALAWSCAL